VRHIFGTTTRTTLALKGYNLEKNADYCTLIGLFNLKSEQSNNGLNIQQ